MQQLLCCAGLSHSVMSDSSRVGSLSLLQGIFPTQGSNPGLPHCRLILYHLSHKGSQGTASEVQTCGDPLGTGG